MPLLAGVLWCETSSPRGRLVTLVLVALGLSWLGDSAPRLTSGDAAFLVMIGFFLLAQVAYIAAFLPFRARSVLHVHRLRLLAYLAAVGALVLACAAGAGATARAGARLRRVPGHDGRARRPGSTGSPRWAGRSSWSPTG